MPAAFLNHKGGMASAADRPNPLLAKLIRQKIASRGLTTHHRDADQIRGFIGIEPLKLLLNNLDFIEIRRGERRDHRKIEMMDMLPLDSLDFEAGGGDE